MTTVDRTPSTAPLAAEPLTCPLCEYDLRGQVDERCPECGFAFTWAELRDAQRDRHPWLFEHGRRRSVRSFGATYVRSAFPRRFWRAVTPANPVHVGRLVVYAVLANAVLAAAALVPLVRVAIAVARSDMATRSTFAVRPDGSFVGPDPAYARPFAFVGKYPGPGVPVVTLTAAELDGLAPRVGSAAYVGQVRDAWSADASRGGVRRRAEADGVAVAVVLAWPWLTLAALLVFQASMRRAKVPARHVLRAVVYGCDLALLTVAAAAVLYGVTIDAPAYSTAYTPGYDDGPWPLATWVPAGPFHWSAMPVVLAVVLCLAVASYRMTVACARYLRFDRPLLTVLVAQAMVVLAVAVVLVRTVRLF